VTDLAKLLQDIWCLLGLNVLHISNCCMCLKPLEMADTAPSLGKWTVHTSPRLYVGYNSPRRWEWEQNITLLYVNMTSKRIARHLLISLWPRRLYCMLLYNISSYWFDSKPDTKDVSHQWSVIGVLFSAFRYGYKCIARCTLCMRARNRIPWQLRCF